MASEADPIELVESAGDEIVDLTCESLEPVVVDLTHNDSVVIVEERRRPRRTARRLRQDQADSCVVSSDEEELSRDRDVYVTTHTPRNAREEAATGPRVFCVSVYAGKLHGQRLTQKPTDVHTGVPVGMLGLANRRPTELQNWTGQQQNVYLLLRQDLLAEETETQRIEFEKLLIVLLTSFCSVVLLLSPPCLAL
ncbi:E3 ubiquitin ligase RNF4 [Camelus ferus]|nr:E3 ubiquitin ligase RNF4 [Camelus ferus]